MDRDAGARVGGTLADRRGPGYVRVDVVALDECAAASVVDSNGRSRVTRDNVPSGYRGSADNVVVSLVDAYSRAGATRPVPEGRGPGRVEPNNVAPDHIPTGRAGAG